MSKAIYGVGLLIAATVATVVTWGAATPLELAAIGMVASLGVTLEASAIAQSLADNRGMGITTRQAAGLRQIIYGTQRVGGISVYQSTTGAGGSGGNYIYNYVIAIATHELDAFQNVYLDGRQVYFSQDGNPANVGCGSVSEPPTTTVTIADGVITGITGTGGSGFANVKPTRYRVRIVDPNGTGTGAWAWATNSGSTTSPVWTVTMTSGGSGYSSETWAEIQGAFTFGGIGAADQQDPTQSGYGLGYGIGPGGPHYDFAGLVYVEARFGDQLPGDYMESLTNNDDRWPATANLGGCAYLYVNIGYNTAQFPQPPEIRVTVNGKNTILDPRTGKSGYTTNWALQVADVITDPVFGLNDNTVNQAQLIAAANICDETVPNSQGGEARYVQCLHYDTGTAPGDALAMMMPAAGGRYSRIGGEWYIFPAAWVGPSVTFDESTLVDSVSWQPYRKFRDLFNYVPGTYVAPNYPYSAIPPFSNLYDSNGWYYGTFENLWNFAFQPTNFPQYAQDTLHGYAANEWLEQDGGIQIPHELTLRGVPSITQAQRLAKITLLRNRFQSSGVFPMSMIAWQCQPLDVIDFSFPAMGLNSAYLEIEKMQLVCEPRRDENGEDGAMALSCAVSLQLVDPSIYEWSETEELLPLDTPALGTGQIPSTPAAPESMTVTSSAGTAIISPDGTVIPQALVSWSAPPDISVNEIQIQYQLASSTTWLDGGTVDVSLFEGFVSPLVAGSAYNFRIRSLRPSGTYSAWVTVTGVVISITLSSSSTTGADVAPPGTLTSWALSTGTAEIVVNPFTATVGGLTVSCMPAGPYTITGLLQSQLYYVYYIDPSFAGGAITPVATLNQSDYLNKVGYFLIGQITTPSYTVRYAPSAYATSGTATVTTPAYAYDNNLATSAYIPSAWFTITTIGPAPAFTPSYTYETVASACVWSGFSAFTTSATTTLNVVAQVNATGTIATGGVIISASIGGTVSTLATVSGASGESTYTLSVPIGTNLSTVSITVSSSVTAGTSPGTGGLTTQVYEIYIQ